MARKWWQELTRRRLRWKWRKKLRTDYSLPGGSIWKWRKKRLLGWIIATLIFYFWDIQAKIPIFWRGFSKNL